MTKDEIELIEGNKEIAIAGNLEWSVVIESMILNTYREALKQGQNEQLEAIEDLKEWAYDNCNSFTQERLNEIIERL